MPRYKLTIEYEGNRFNGWQRQQSNSSVQGTIEQGFKTVFQTEVLVEGAGRTDAGVHALGQVAHVDLPGDNLPHRVCDGLNFFLRDRGVAVLNVEIVPDTFHARFSAIGRIYEYRILNRRAPLVLEANRAWHVIGPLDILKMQEATTHFLGHHNFTSFRATLCQAPSPFKTIDVFNISHTSTPEGDYITAQIASRSFLHNQVRIMIGTLKQIGEGRLSPEDIPSILQACDRRASGPTAPPQGLYLKRVNY